MLILASGSERRAEILKMLGFDFIIKIADCDENVSGIPTAEIVAVLAERKAMAVAAEHPDDTVLGSDTLVALGDTVLGKPKDKKDAARMLRLLSGKRHKVYTGVSIITNGKSDTFVSESEVEFFDLSDEQIKRYVDSKEPLDKAGAYGIQGKGAALVKNLNGDFFSVMGLPAALVARKLEKLTKF